MTTKITVPGITPANIANDEKVTMAVNAYTDAEAKASGTKSDAILFLWSVATFREDVTQGDLSEVYGAKKSAVSKGGKVVRHYMAEMFPDRSETFTVADYVALADRVRSDYGTIFKAYNELFPPKKSAPATPADLIRKAWRKWHTETNGTPEEFALYALGTVESLLASGDDDDDENDDDQ